MAKPSREPLPRGSPRVTRARSRAGKATLVPSATTPPDLRRRGRQTASRAQKAKQPGRSTQSFSSPSTANSEAPDPPVDDTGQDASEVVFFSAMDWESASTESPSERPLPPCGACLDNAQRLREVQAELASAQADIQILKKEVASIKLQSIEKQFTHQESPPPEPIQMETPAPVDEPVFHEPQPPTSIFGKVFGFFSPSKPTIAATVPHKRPADFDQSNGPLEFETPSRPSSKRRRIESASPELQQRQTNPFAVQDHAMEYETMENQVTGNDQTPSVVSEEHTDTEQDWEKLLPNCVRKIQIDPATGRLSSRMFSDRRKNITKEMEMQYKLWSQREQGFAPPEDEKTRYIREHVQRAYEALIHTYGDAYKVKEEHCVFRKPGKPSDFGNTLLRIRQGLPRHPPGSQPKMPILPTLPPLPVKEPTPEREDTEDAQQTPKASSPGRVYEFPYSDLDDESTYLDASTPKAGPSPDEGNTPKAGPSPNESNTAKAGPSPDESNTAKAGPSPDESNTSKAGPSLDEGNTAKALSSPATSVGKTYAFPEFDPDSSDDEDDVPDNAASQTEKNISVKVPPQHASTPTEEAVGWEKHKDALRNEWDSFVLAREAERHMRGMAAISEDERALIDLQYRTDFQDILNERRKARVQREQQKQAGIFSPWNKHSRRAAAGYYDDDDMITSTSTATSQTFATNANPAQPSSTFNSGMSNANANVQPSITSQATATVSTPAPAKNTGNEERMAILKAKLKAQRANTASKRPPATQQAAAVNGSSSVQDSSEVGDQTQSAPPNEIAPTANGSSSPHGAAPATDEATPKAPNQPNASPSSVFSPFAATSKPQAAASPSSVFSPFAATSKPQATTSFSSAFSPFAATSKPQAAAGSSSAFSPFTATSTPQAVPSPNSVFRPSFAVTSTPQGAASPSSVFSIKPTTAATPTFPFTTSSNQAANAFGINSSAPGTTVPQSSPAFSTLQPPPSPTPRHAELPATSAPPESATTFTATPSQPSLQAQAPVFSFNGSSAASTSEPLASAESLAMPPAEAVPAMPEGGPSEGWQAAQIQRKMQEVDRYKPKSSSGLRNVSRLSMSAAATAAVDGNPSTMPGAPNGEPTPAFDQPQQEVEQNGEASHGDEYDDDDELVVFQPYETLDPEMQEFLESLNDNPAIQKHLAKVKETPPGFLQPVECEPPATAAAEPIDEPEPEPYPGLSVEDSRDVRNFLIKYNRENPEWWVKAAGGEEAWDAKVTRMFHLTESYPMGPWPNGPPPGFK